MTSRLALTLALSHALRLAAAPPAAPPATARPVAERRTSLVDPFIGTGGHGHTYPGATLPFGMVQLSPDTRVGGWDGSSGYHASDRAILGFSHTHLSGTGVPDYGDVLLVPGTGPVRWESGAGQAAGSGYSSPFRKETEKARPGFYSVRLDGPGVLAELTATRRVGVHRYTFPRGVPAHVLVDLSHREAVLESWLRVVSDREVAGYRRVKGWAKDRPVFFTARFSRPFSGRAIRSGGVVREGAFEGRGTDVRAVLGWDDGGSEPLVVKVSLSAVDVPGTVRNLEAELPDFDFDRVVREADAAWEEELGKVRVEGGTREQRTVFATALYHAFLAPNLFTDADGRYRGRDGKVHGARDFTAYTVFSLWDTFRAEHPLLTIVDTKRTVDFVKTFLAQYRQARLLPVWELWANETDCMIGYHAVPVIADAILKGIGGFDAEEAYAAMVASAEGTTRGLPAYRRLGYVPAEGEHESVSKTLEYAYDDWCIARVAARLGKKADEERFLRRAQGYLHLFDPSTGFFRGRMNGLFFSPFDPHEVNFNYTEGNAWHYAFSVPQDVAGLTRLLGGKEALGKKLDALFEASSSFSGTQLDDLTGLIGQYAHGNEPVHHVAWLYPFAGRPWETQRRVRQILETLYTTGPEGLPGNEDCGQMSAWYVLSALGFYPVTPGSPDYVLGAPLFPEAAIRLENGKSFVIRAPGVSAERPYVRSVRLNGKRWTRSSLPHAAIAAGGELVLEMGPEPDRRWGTGEGNEPTSAIDGPRVLPAPFVDAASRSFQEPFRVTAGCVEPDATVRYTLDGSEPGPSSPVAAGPIEIARTATLRLRAEKAGFLPTPVVDVPFVRIPAGRDVKLATAYRPRYSGGGPKALVDGIRGGPDFRTGGWQGYNGVNLDATVDLGAVTAVKRLSTGFLQDQRSWVFMPLAVTYSVSVDGVSWQEAGTVANDVDERTPEPLTKEFALAVSPRPVRFVRVVGTNRKVCPPWHPGAGEDAFVMADEITVE